jgi:hypothetical protein
MESQWSKYGEFLGTLTDDVVSECSHSSDCYEDVEYWVKELEFNVPEHLGRMYIKDTGAWEDWDTCDMKTLNERVLWLACCDIKEQGEWFGVCQ